MLQSLPGIRRIAYIDCELLPTDITLRALSSTPIRLSSSLTDVPLGDKALFETEIIPDNNSQVEKATLTFSSLDQIPAHHHLAFFVESLNGERYIIGTHERPFPTVKVSQSTGMPSEDPSVSSYEVTITAKKALSPCSL